MFQKLYPGHLVCLYFSGCWLNPLFESEMGLFSSGKSDDEIFAFVLALFAGVAATPSATVTYTVGGSIQGYDSGQDGLVLSLGGAASEDWPISQNTTSFIFLTKLNTGDAFSASIKGLVFGGGSSIDSGTESGSISATSFNTIGDTCTADWILFWIFFAVKWIVKYFSVSEDVIILISRPGRFSIFNRHTIFS